MLDDLREYILGGRTLDLAVAVLVAVSLGDVIRSFVANLTEPLLGASGPLSVAGLHLGVAGMRLAVGLFIADVVHFLLIASAAYLLVVRPLGRLRARRAVVVGEATTSCRDCLSTIPTRARRCAFCHTVQPLRGIDDPSFGSALR